MLVLVVMGVSGSGKTTIGTLIAERIGASFEEGDSYHPAPNIAKMSRGEPLNDQDRAPWLENLSRSIGTWTRGARPTVLACSALKASYRDILRAGRSEVRFVFLRGTPEVIMPRLAERQGHYMPPSLLASQLEALEEPDDAIVLDVGDPPGEIADRIITQMQERRWI